MIELHEVPDFFSLWYAMPSGRVLKKRSFALVSFIDCGFFAAPHISSSAGVRVLCISELRAVSHRVSLVHISSILLSAHNCPRVSSPFSEGNFHPFGSAWAMPPCSVFHASGLGDLLQLLLLRLLVGPVCICHID